MTKKITIVSVSLTVDNGYIVVASDNSIYKISNNEEIEIIKYNSKNPLFNEPSFKLVLKLRDLLIGNPKESVV